MPTRPDDHAVARALIGWYRHNARDLPWRRRDFHDAYGAWGVLVSEFMLQQTPATRVQPLLARWLERWPSPQATAQATPAQILHAWANLGYPRRALWLHSAAVHICEHHGGEVPDRLEDLLALPGVGEYTARAVAVFAYGQRHPVVDTNTRRVIARAVLGLSQPGPASPRDRERMERLLPTSDEQAATVNAAAMELGATVCVSRSPRCAQCPIAHLCAWHGAGHPDTGDHRPRQARYEGSDRQARGAVMAQLRAADGHTVDRAAAIADWPDTDQRERAIRSLIADGLAETDQGLLFLPR